MQQDRQIYAIRIQKENHTSVCAEDVLVQIRMEEYVLSACRMCGSAEAHNGRKGENCSGKHMIYSITTCEFQDVIGEDKVGTVRKGYIFGNDRHVSFNDTWTTVPYSDFEILEKILHDCYNVENLKQVRTQLGMLRDIAEQKCRVIINGAMYEFQDIQSMLEKYEKG